MFKIIAILENNANPTQIVNLVVCFDKTTRVIHIVCIIRMITAQRSDQ